MDKENLNRLENSTYTHLFSEDHTTILDNKYVLLKTLGQGKTSTVKLGMVKKSGLLVAVKILKESKSKDTIFSNEIEALLKLDDENIIKFIDYSFEGLLQKPSSMKIISYIVLENAENGELFDYLYYTKLSFGEKYGQYIFKEIINALDYVHRKNFVHRDLKIENIMISSDWKIKLTDFGFAKFNDHNLLNTFVGTKSYAPPEILSNNKYFGMPCDVFSCGVTIFAVVTGRKPFGVNGSAHELDTYYRYIFTGDYEKFWKMHEGIGLQISSEFKSLINLMLAFDPAQRPTINEIKNHPWYLKNCISSEEMTEEFIKRKEIIQAKKEVEIMKNFENDLVNAKIPDSLNHKPNVIRVYRSGKYKGNNIICEGKNIELTQYFEFDTYYLKNYMDSFHPYLLRFRNVSEEVLFKYIYYYMYSINCKVVAFTKTYSMEVLNEKLFLSILVKIFSYEEGSLIVEFKKIEGEKEQLLEIFENFKDSLKLIK